MLPVLACKYRHHRTIHSRRPRVQPCPNHLTSSRRPAVTPSTSIPVALPTGSRTGSRTSSSSMIISSRHSPRYRRCIRRFTARLPNPTKSLNAAPELIERLRQCGANRQTRIVAIGGGVIQDLTTFVASSTCAASLDIRSYHDPRDGGLLHRRQVLHQRRPVQESGREPFIHLSDLHRSSDGAHPSHRPAASGIIEAAKICFCRGARIISRLPRLQSTCGHADRRADTACCS